MGGACSRWGVGRLQRCIYVREGTTSTTIDRAARCSLRLVRQLGGRGKDVNKCLDKVSGHFSHQAVSPQPNLGPSQSLAQENLQSRPPSPSEACLDKAVAHLHEAMCAVGLVVGWMVGCVVVPSQSDVLPGGQWGVWWFRRWATCCLAGSSDVWGAASPGRDRDLGDRDWSWEELQVSSLWTVRQRTRLCL